MRMSAKMETVNIHYNLWDSHTTLVVITGKVNIKKHFCLFYLLTYARPI